MKNIENFNFKGPFAEHAENFIRHKRSLGYKYETEKKMMRLFCEFSCQYPVDKCNLSKELIEAWFANMNDVASKTRELRKAIIKLFAEYMRNMGYPAYVVPKQKIRSTNHFIPYVFSHQEISDILRTCDSMKYEWRSKHTQLLLPVILRLLYSSGLRISEALTLKVKDVDLVSGVLTLRQTKTDKDRYIPLSASTLIFMKSYFSEMHSDSEHQNFFFRKYDGGSFCARTIYQYFKKILWKSGISYGGKGKGPRLHDLRHTFAVHSLSRWVYDKKDIYCLLPVLATYLGHSDIRATGRYLRLTAEVFPKLIETIESHCEFVIPEVKTV